MSAPVPLLNIKELLLLVEAALEASTEIENYKPVVEIKGKDFGKIEMKANFDCVRRFSRCKFINLTISSGKHFKTSFSDCTVESHFSVIGGHFEQGLFISRNALGGLYFNELNGNRMVPSSVHISNNIIENYVLFSNVDFTALFLTDNKAKTVTLTNSLYERETGQWVMGKTEYLIITLTEETTLRVENFKIKNFGLRGIVSNVDLDLSNVQINSLKFTGVRKLSSGTITISRLYPLGENSQVKLINSLMGNTVFHDCDFASFSSFSVTNSQLTEIVYTNTKWPNTFTYQNDIHGRKDDKITQHNQYREIYRQLKMMASKQGDKLLENRFYNKEMAYLIKSMDKSGLETKLSLWLNYLSNDFRQSWLRPIFWILLLNIVFTLILCSNDFCHLHFKAKVFFNLLNPTHRFVDMEIDSNFFSLMIDLLSRIVNGYLFYQTVAAFRKLS